MSSARNVSGLIQLVLLNKSVLSEWCCGCFSGIGCLR